MGRKRKPEINPFVADIIERENRPKKGYYIFIHRVPERYCGYIATPKENGLDHITVVKNMKDAHLYDINVPPVDWIDMLSEEVDLGDTTKDLREPVWKWIEV